MTRRYVLAPEAALDLVRIWRYIAKQSSVEIADHVEVGHSGQDRFSGDKPRCRTLAQEFDG
jgi:plasmid stabilization system protein ParE